MSRTLRLSGPTRFEQQQGGAITSRENRASTKLQKFA
jgi:hypothetical protein